MNMVNTLYDSTCRVRSGSQHPTQSTGSKNTQPLRMTTGPRLDRNKGHFFDAIQSNETNFWMDGQSLSLSLFWLHARLLVRAGDWIQGT